jgi:hypothetical protein
MKVLEFTTILQPSSAGRIAFIPIDDATREALGGGGRIPVRATFNGVEYRGSICKMGGAFCLGINRAVREAAKAEAGDSVRVTLERDTAPRTVAVPSELASALRKNQPASKAFEKLSFTHRKEYVRWIESAKKTETREARIVKAIEMLRAGTRTPDAPHAKR